MPALIVTILAAFASSLVARMLLGAGLAFLSYTWVNDLVLQAQTEMSGLFNSIPSDVLGLLSIMKVPQAISVVMSAIGISIFIKTSKVFLGRAG